MSCATEAHYPFVLKKTEDGGHFYGHVRTTSWELDGCGGRTDIHDLLPVLWALVLRANGAASTTLVDFEGWTGFPELESRMLLFSPTGSGVRSVGSEDRDLIEMQAHTAWAFHALHGILRWTEWKDGDWVDDEPPFLASVRKVISFSEDDALYGRRSKPDWQYFRDHKQGISIAVLEKEQIHDLRVALAGFEGVSVQGTHRQSVLACGIGNAVPDERVRLGSRLIHAIEGHTHPIAPLGTSPLDGICIVPLENHCAILGLRTLVVMRAQCGLRAFSAERTKFLEKRERENAVFLQEATFTWSDKLDDARFEELIYELLQREPGVNWARKAAPTRERDAGRDMIVSWTRNAVQCVPPGTRAEAIAEERPRNWVVQVKAHRPSVGKGKVTDIRDTLERHRAEGYLLVAHPEPTRQLVDHLEVLGNTLQVDWWDRAQIEGRLRLAPDIAARFSDLVVLSRRKDDSRDHER